MFIYLQNVKTNVSKAIRKSPKDSKSRKSIVFIQDIVVLPEYQRQGIGTALLKHVLDTYAHVYQKILLTDNTEKTIRFYKSLGFQMDTEIECRAFMKMR